MKSFKADDIRNRDIDEEQELSPSPSNDDRVSSTTASTPDSQDRDGHGVANLLLGDIARGPTMNSSFLLPFSSETTTLSAEEQRFRTIAIIEKALGVINSEEDFDEGLPMTFITSHVLPDQ